MIYLLQFSVSISHIDICICVLDGREQKGSVLRFLPFNWLLQVHQMHVNKIKPLALMVKIF